MYLQPLELHGEPDTTRCHNSPAIPARLRVRSHARVVRFLTNNVRLWAFICVWILISPGIIWLLTTDCEIVWWTRDVTYDAQK